jgi:hypothetical protein
MLAKTYILEYYKTPAGVRTTLNILGGNNVTVKFSEVHYYKLSPKQNEPYCDKKVKRVT